MKDYMELLLHLIECRPVSADIEAVNKAGTVMKEFLESHGIHCVMEEINGYRTLYASSRPGKVQDILLNAHLDVVPAINEAQFIPYEKDGELYARGAGDCLGNAVCIARFLCNIKASASIGAIFTSDEEIGGLTTKEMISRGYGARKCAVVLDSGGDYNITYAQKGILILKLTARSSGGHSSSPWAFVNPIDMLVTGYQKLRAAWENPVATDDWKNSMVPCMISGGFAENQIPDVVEMVVNFRYIADEDYQKIIDLVRETTGLEVSVLRTCPPVASNTDAPAMQLLRQAFQNVLSRPVNFIRMCGATDARYLKSLGVPVGIIGVETAGVHSAKEKLKIESINTCQKILAEYVRLLEN